jgi:predicted DsbA family dithiol-disulfide isomerase
VWNTFDAHRLLAWAGTLGGDGQRRLKHALLEAYHAQGRNPGDRAVLLELAAGLGLDAAEAAQALDGDRFSTEVRTLEQQWQEAGIQAVPSVIVEGRHLIQGGQPPEVFEQALRQLAGLEGTAQ